jgi:hypothetical protein
VSAVDAPQASRFARYRLLAAVAVTSGPLFFLVLPALLFPQPHETPAENLAAYAEEAAARQYIPLLLQLVGAVWLVAVALGILHVLLQRRRAIAVGYAGAAALLIGAFSAMTAIGMELAQIRVVHLDEDTAAMVDVALAIQEGAVFGTFLFATLLGVFLGMLVLAAGLWQAGVIPPWPLLLFLVPIAVAFLPLPGRGNEIGALVVLLVPLLWISIALGRTATAAELSAEAGSPTG